MSTAINPTIQQPYGYSAKGTSMVKQFFSWSAAQQENRFLWLAIAVAGHGCAITPLTVYFVYLTGMNFALVMTALMAMAMAFVVNLAALPTKVTIPVFFLSVIIDILVIAAAVGMAFNS